LAKWASIRDVKSLPRREEFVNRMALRGSDAAMRGVTINLEREEFVSHMAQK
jgi:hypothetical protein